ncbi:MAG: hypothetical protein J0H11_21760 [Rhizobiales bacterium]|nr:hypothetical protein [Hyphomicrobiales bacterium]
MAATIAAGELSHRGRPRGSGARLSSKPLQAKVELTFQARVTEWQIERDLPAAEELVAAAIASQRFSDPDAQDAATLLTRDGSASPTTRQLANLFLKSTSDAIHSQRRNLQLRLQLNKRKRLLEIYPRDSLLLTETALIYLFLADRTKAAHFLWRASALTPNDRYVARSMVRFLVHIGDPEAAVAFSRRLTASFHDPWLLSAMLAAGEAAGVPVQGIREARRMLSSKNFSEFDLGELASAVASIQLRNGGDRLARRHFRQSLLDPTENAVAQAEWARRRDGLIDVTQAQLSVPGAFEAMAWEAYATADWQRSLDATRKWFEAEPFSPIPAIHGSFLAAEMLHDPATALSLADDGLVFNKHEPTLLNNKAVALALLGRLDDAEQTLSTVGVGNDGIAIKATRGLIAMRRGNLTVGAESYLQAIQMAVDARTPEIWARASAHFAREIGRYSPAIAVDIAGHVERAVLSERWKSVRVAPDVAVLLNQVKAIEAVDGAIDHIEDIRREFIERSGDVVV